MQSDGKKDIFRYDLSRQITGGRMEIYMKTVIGLDYGTQSARALLVDTKTGQVLLSHTIKYKHGVIDGDLADADDYEAALYELLEHVTPAEYRNTIVGICIDATSLTLVPLAKDGRVLSQIPEIADRHHSQIKLWKYHRAQKQADEALALAEKMKESFLNRTGGSISSEWTLPKLLKIRDEDPEVYRHMDYALDLCEFLTYRLTGTISRSTASMCFKGLWADDLGLPSSSYLNSLRDGLAEEYYHVMRGEVYRPGDKVGYLKEDLCVRYGLNKDVAIATGVLDGHTALIALGSLRPGDAALVIGTSNVFTIQTEELKEVPGICGIAMNGLTSELYGIDSGQSGTGDMLEWYVNHAMPESIHREALEKNISVHEVLCEKIKEPWNNQVIATDWWNGSRNTPCDLNLKGIISGMTLNTKAEDIYLALLQAIVCGTGEIIRQCESYGIKVSRLVASGGIANKNPLLMQEYANLLNRQIFVGQVTEGPALGSAIFAAVAAGIYKTPIDAYEVMGEHDFTIYEPDQQHRAEYEKLYKKNQLLRQITSQIKL